MKFREFTTSSGKKVLGGKDAEQNEELVNQFLGKENLLFHTEKPGSSFCIILDLKPTKKDLKEVAIFCASKSQDWRDNKQDVNIHIFSGKEVYKWKRMPAGTFGVKKFQLLKIKKKEIEDLIKV
jgi:predicted ribosome quality control (RQC) complex YloA/Tae2 family protein